MTHRKKRSFSPEFRLECAQLIIDQDYTVKEAAEAMNVGQSTVDNWAKNYVLNALENQVRALRNT